MPKKSKRKNRPKRKPVKREIKQPESNPLLTRRRAILTLAGAGGAALAWRAGLFDVFKNEEKPEEEEKKAEPPKEDSKLPEYNEWAAEIELPNIEYNPNQSSWTEEQIDNHFISKKIDRESLPPFYKTFDELTDILMDKLESTTDLKERNQLINNYFGTIFELIFERKFKDDELREAISKTSRMLIPHGNWIGADRERGEAFNKYVIYAVDKVNSLKVNMGDKWGHLPVVSLKDKQDFGADPNAKSVIFNGVYSHDNGCIVVDDSQIFESAKSINDFEELCEDLGIDPGTNGAGSEFMKIITLMHESMHAVSHKMSGDGRPEPSKKIKADKIDMGHYTLDTRQFGKITHIEADELASNGFGTLSSGDLAHLTLYQVHTGARHNATYNFSSFVILNEILHSESLDTVFKTEFLKELSSGEIQDKDFVRFLMKISPQERVNMGERMAKLGMYLTQE